MEKYVELVATRNSLKKIATNAERMQGNKSIRSIIASLDEELE